MRLMARQPESSVGYAFASATISVDLHARHVMLITALPTVERTLIRLLVN